MCRSFFEGVASSRGNLRRDDRLHFLPVSSFPLIWLHNFVCCVFWRQRRTAINTLWLNMWMRSSIPYNRWPGFYFFEQPREQKFCLSCFLFHSLSIRSGCQLLQTGRLLGQPQDRLPWQMPASLCRRVCWPFWDTSCIWEQQRNQGQRGRRQERREEMPSTS